MQKKHLSVVERQLGFGVWELDIPTGSFYHSPGLSIILGINSDAVVLDLTMFQSMIHPMDRKDGWVASFKAAPTEREMSFRIIRADNTVRHLQSTIIPTCDISGKLIKLLGIVSDNSSTALKEKELTQTRSMTKFVRQCLNCFVLRISTQGEIIDGVDVFQHLGQDIDAVVNNIYDIVEAADKDRLKRLIQNTVDAGTPSKGSIKFALSNGEVRKYNVNVSIDHVAGRLNLHEITYLIFANPVEAGEPASSEKFLLNAKQIRAARTILGWSVEEFSERIGLSISTIRRVEIDATAVKHATLEKIKATFEESGMKFENKNGRKISWQDIDSI